jgi:predicted TIM-barrel fold metal-dependent hydrolase
MATPMREAARRVETSAETLVDCDVHNVIADEALNRRLPARWRQYRERYGGRDHTFAGMFPRMYPFAARTDSWPPSGLPPGGDLGFMREQLLDQWSISCAVLFPFGLVGEPNAAFAAACARAQNDCQLEDWLQGDDRLRSSLTLGWEDAPSAVAEIERMGGHPGFVQVAAFCRSPALLGNQRYWPILEAAAEAGLPVAIHFGGWSTGFHTGSGRPTFYSEEKGGIATAAQDQLTSLVCNGVFERFPKLRVISVENGFAWLPALIWRLDRAWHKLAADVPELTRPPSEYIREHVWVTTQPIEEPPTDAQFMGLLTQMGMDDRIMFSTDYPHWDFDSPTRALPNAVPPELRAKIMGRNAIDLYGLEIETSDA